jgi:hypothetical protein
LGYYVAKRNHVCLGSLIDMFTDCYLKGMKYKPGVMAHASNPRYTGGIGRRIIVQAYPPHPKKTLTTSYPKK